MLTSPVLLVLGEPLRKLAHRRVGARARPTGNGGLFISRRYDLTVWTFFSNPLVIALTAPGRWVGDRLRR